MLAKQISAYSLSLGMAGQVDLLMRNEDLQKTSGLQINKEPLERKLPQQILLGSIK
jgi:hypothetical protein